MPPLKAGPKLSPDFPGLFPVYMIPYWATDTWKLQANQPANKARLVKKYWNLLNSISGADHNILGILL